MFRPFWRKFLLVLRVTSSVGFIGAIAGFLALAIAGLATGTDSVAFVTYPAMQIVAWYVIFPLAIATLTFGILQSLASPFGLIRHYWVVIKLALTVLSLVVLALQMDTIDLLANAVLNGSIGELMTQRFAMVLHASGGIGFLLVAIVLSIYKPRGLTGVEGRADVAGP